MSYSTLHYKEWIRTLSRLEVTKVGDRKLLIRDPKGHGRGQADNPWIPRRSGHIYMGPSPLCGTLSYRHSSPPMEEPTNTTAWTSSASATPSMTSPSTVLTGFSSCDMRSFTENYNISRDTGSSSVSRCLVKGCVKFCLNC